MSSINISLTNIGPIHQIIAASPQQVSIATTQNNLTGNFVYVSMQVCNSNSTLWTLSQPVCSTNFSSFATFVIVAILLGVITLWTIFGNILVWVALYKFPNLRSMSNCLIGNLAVSDMLLAVTVLPIATGHDLLGYWVFGDTMCTIWLCIDVLYCTASIWGLCTIAVDRYTATVYPMWYHERRSPMRALMYIIFVWVFSIIVSLAPFIGWRDMIPNLFQFVPGLNRYECVLFETEGYVLYSAMGSFVIPFILMTFLYVRIFIVLRKRAKTMNHHRKMKSLSDFDYDSCAIQESSSQLELANGPVTMTDKATQISPVSKKEMFAASSCNSNSNNQLTNDRKTSNHASYISLDKPENTCDRNDHLSSPQVGNDILPDIVIRSYKEMGTKEEKQPCLTISNMKHLSSRKQNGHVDKMISTKNEVLTNDKAVSPAKSLQSADESKHRRDSNRFFTKGRTSSIKISKAKQHRNKHSSGIKTKYELREQRATKRMAIVMGCFLVCWIPFLFMYTIRSFCTGCYFNVHIQASIIWLGYANSGINPILYTLFNDDFRKAFKIILGLKKRKKKIYG